VTLVLDTIKVEPLSLAAQPVADTKALDQLAFGFVQKVAQSFSDVVRAHDPVTGETTLANDLRERISGDHAYVAFRMVPFKATIIAALPLLLIRALVDLDYGGDGNVADSGAALLRSERRYFERLEADIGRALVAVWQEASGAEVSAIRLAMGTSLPSVFNGDQQLALHRFGYVIGKAKPLTATLIMPAAMVRHIACQKPLTKTVEDSRDPLWTHSFGQAVMQTRLPVRTILAQPEVPVSQLLGLKPGDVIPLRLTDRLAVIAGDCRFAEASLGEANGRAAIQIHKTLEGNP
jgi:flagellar motor switch protein FliM